MTDNFIELITDSFIRRHPVTAKTLQCMPKLVFQEIDEFKHTLYTTSPSQILCPIKLCCINYASHWCCFSENKITGKKLLFVRFINDNHGKISVEKFITRSISLTLRFYFNYRVMKLTTVFNNCIINNNTWNIKLS